jgi:uncharacterized protein
LKSLRLRSFAPLLPYLAVCIGLFLVRNAWFTLLGYHVGIILILSVEKQWAQARKLFRMQRILWSLGAILFGALGGGLLYFLWPYLGIHSFNFNASLTKLGLNGRDWIAFILYFSLINPWMEELYWRGYLGSDKRGPILADGYFSGYHLIVLGMYVGLPWLLVSFIVLGVAAWLWRQFARSTGGLLLPVLSHLAADLSLILVIYRATIGFL